VNYDEDNWKALAEQLHKNPNDIHVLNRAQLIDDAFNLARVEKLNYTFVLDLTEYLEKENDVVPWYSVKNGFSYLIDRMRRCPHSYKNFKVGQYYKCFLKVSEH
jgi:aminopeptidase N